MKSSERPTVTIKDIFNTVSITRPKPDEKTQWDPLILAEFQLTLAEYERLIEKYGETVVTPNQDTLQPFRDFMMNRWQRISGMSEAKLTAADVYSKAIVTMSPEDIQKMKQENDALDAELLALKNTVAQPLETAGPLEKKELTPEQREARRKDIFDKAKKHAEQSHTEQLKRIKADVENRHKQKTEQPVIPPETITIEQTLKSLKTKLRWQLAEEKIASSILPKGTDLIFATHQPANLLYKDVGKKIQEINTQRQSLKSKVVHDKQINSILMPTVDPIYRFYENHHPAFISIDTLTSDQFILTDNGKLFIPIFHTMTQAALHARNTGQLEFRTGISFADRHGSRVLTASEQERLRNHSSVVRNYYQAIEQFIVWKKKQEASRRPISIGIILQHFLDGRYAGMTWKKFLSYLDALPLEQARKLFAMKFHYVPVSGESSEEGFGVLVRHYLAGHSNYPDKLAYQNLQRFLVRHTFAFNDRKDLDAVPPNRDLSPDPLVSATAQFEEAMKQSSIEVTATYGDPGRQRLVNQLYSQQKFPAVIQAMHDEKGVGDLEKITDYLQAMPVEKMPAFGVCLSQLHPATYSRLLGVSFHNDAILPALKSAMPVVVPSDHSSPRFFTSHSMPRSSSLPTAQPLSPLSVTDSLEEPLLRKQRTHFAGKFSDWLNNSGSSKQLENSVKPDPLKRSHSR